MILWFRSSSGGEEAVRDPGEVAVCSAFCSWMEEVFWNPADAFCLQALKWVLNFINANASGHRARYLVGAWFSGGLGSVRLTVRPNDLKGLFQPHWFCDSTEAYTYGGKAVDMSGIRWARLLGLSGEVSFGLWLSCALFGTNRSDGRLELGHADGWCGWRGWGMPIVP